MKVLMISRATLHSSVGGDTIQILETANALRKMGVQVDVKLTTDVIDYSEYDILHFFNIIRPADILRHIAKTNKPFVVSTIFVDYEEFEKNNRQGFLKFVNRILSSDQLEYLKAAARFILNGEKIGSLYYLMRGHRRSVKYIIKNAALLLPNSNSEYARLVKKYGLEQLYEVIPNAISLDKFGDRMQSLNMKREGVLCVGRIEGRKNQLELIKSLKNTGLTLTIIGNPSPNNISYYNLCVQEVGNDPNVKFIKHCTQTELTEYYLKNKVHVLPSWFETTGLVSLEAAVLGCNIVVSSKGDTKEYFEDYAEYCDPDNNLSIKNSVLKAYDCNWDPSFRNKVIDLYNWDKAAELTFEAYKAVVSK